MSVDDKITIERELGAWESEHYPTEGQDHSCIHYHAFIDLIDLIERLVEDERRAWIKEMNQLIKETMENPEYSRATTEAAMRSFVNRRTR
jgi:hypothetical protein